MSAATLDNGRFYGGLRSERSVSGLTLAETGYGAGFRVPPHDHRHPFFCLTLDGSFTERFERRRWSGSPATVFYHPAGAEHAEVFGDAGGRLFNIQLGGPWLGRLAPYDLRPPERQVRADGGRFARLATELYREFRARDDAALLAIDGLAMELLAHVIRGDHPRPGGARPGWLGRAEELLHDRVAEPMDIAAVAEAVDTHPVHLARVFRRHHGCSPGEYLRRIRIHRACGLLSGSDASLAAVAYSCGYADQSHFTRQFKRALGMTPGAYRGLVGTAPPSEPGARPVP